MSLLWPYWVKRSLLQEIIDVIIVYLNVGDKHAVATVLIHPFSLRSFFWSDHVSKLWINSLPAKQNMMKHGNSTKITSQHTVLS